MVYNFKVGDYVRNNCHTAYFNTNSLIEEWMKKNCSNKYLFDRQIQRGAPDEGECGTIMFMAETVLFGEVVMLMYFLTDNGDGYIVDKDNFWGALYVPDEEQKGVKMDFKVGDYVENKMQCAYLSGGRNWLVRNKVKQSLIDRWEHDAPEIGIKGTIVFVAPYYRAYGESITAYYFLSDEGKGYVIDYHNLTQRGSILLPNQTTIV